VLKSSPAVLKRSRALLIPSYTTLKATDHVMTPIYTAPAIILWLRKLDHSLLPLGEGLGMRV
jgi:hypothetical protein